MDRSALSQGDKHPLNGLLFVPVGAANFRKWLHCVGLEGYFLTKRGGRDRKKIRVLWFCLWTVIARVVICARTPQEITIKNVAQ